ncbi:glycerophosphodiester phosphodiesterase [Streptomyces sp. NPDC002547]
MARHRFGGIADYVISVGTDNAATLQPGTSVTCWNVAVGGAQYTDLTDTDGTTPISGGTLTADSAGSVPEFFGPDNVAELYLDASGGSGPRRRTTATDLGSAIVSVQTGLTMHEDAVNPHGTALSDLVDQAIPSVAGMLAQTPFTIAHRGSGDEFPEHTLAAYESVLAAGASAIEVSVNITADGVPVCIHDTTLDRTTDHTGPVNAWPYSALRENVRATGQGLLGNGWEGQPLPTLREVLDRLYGRCVIFLECKQSAAVAPVLDLLDSLYPGGPRSIVWKGYYTDGSFAGVRSRGYKVWAYMDAGTTDAQLNAVDTNVDIWGVPFAMTDARITAVIGRGKPVICWEVHRHADVARLTGLGVQGLMEAGWVYLNNQPQIASSDPAFTSQVAMPGTLGPQTYSAPWALKYDSDGAAHFDQLSGYSVLMGGMRAPSPDTFTLEFAMKWNAIPAATLHSGVALCKASDDVFQFSGPNNASGGYHFLLRGNGDMQLYRHDAGVTSGTQLGAIATQAPVAGQWMTFTIQVTPTQIIVTRTDTATHYTFTVTNNVYRGPYWHLSNGSITSLANQPFWKDLAVS